MNRINKINEKILFIKEYWDQLLYGKIDFFDNAYIVDLKSILIDLKDTIERVKDYRPRFGRLNYGDLSYICDEFILYYKFTYFRKSQLSKQLLDIKIEIELNNYFKNINIHKRDQYRKSMNRIVNNIELCITIIEENNNYYSKILKEIKSICLNNNNLKLEIEQLKVYLSELMSAAYEEEMSSDYLKKIFEAVQYKCIPICNIRNFLDLQFNSDKKEITYIFSIKNFYMQQPIKVGNILLYNPMRKDLLEYMAQEIWHEEDYCLLTREKQEIFDKYKIREGGCGYPNGKYDEYILWTDCHARIKIMALDVREGVERAKQEVRDLLSIICYRSNLNNIHIQESYAAFNEDKEESLYPLFIMDRDLSPTYYVRGINEDIRESALNQNSTLNKILSLNNRGLISKAMYWYNNAVNIENIQMKYLGYFICIETLLGASNEYYYFKDKLLNIVPDIIIMSSYYNELIYIYKYFKNLFSSISRRYKQIPKDILAIEGLENFLIKIDLNAFRNNFQVFYKYCESPYIKSIMMKYKRIYSDKKFREQSIKDLRTKLIFVFSRIYRFRNQIVHRGEINKFQINQNAEFLRYSARILIESITIDIEAGDVDEDIVRKISNHQIQEHFSNWINSFI